jgi:hypothetical protein
MRGLFRILFLLVLISAGISLIRGLFKALVSPQAKPEVPGSAAVGRLVKDPVCGTYVPEHTAIHAGDHFFCSEECRVKFLKAG